MCSSTQYTLKSIFITYPRHIDNLIYHCCWLWQPSWEHLSDSSTGEIAALSPRCLSLWKEVIRHSPRLMTGKLGLASSLKVHIHHFKFYMDYLSSTFASVLDHLFCIDIDSWVFIWNLSYNKTQNFIFLLQSFQISSLGVLSVDRHVSHPLSFN